MGEDCGYCIYVRMQYAPPPTSRCGFCATQRKYGRRNLRFAALDRAYQPGTIIGPGPTTIASRAHCAYRMVPSGKLTSVAIFAIKPLEPLEVTDQPAKVWLVRVN